MSQRPIDVCGYCGRTGVKLEKEHVFAKKILFPGSHAMTTRACERCNLEKSKLDLVFRDQLGLRIQSHNDSSLKFLTDATVRSAEKEGRSRPARKMLLTFETVSVVGKDGTLLRQHSQVTASGDDVRKALLWIARGIYAFHQRSVLPVHDFCSREFTKPNEIENKMDFPGFGDGFDEAGSHAVGNSVRYKVLLLDTSPPYLWVRINLYGHYMFEAHVNARSFEAAIRANAEEMPDYVAGILNSNGMETFDPPLPRNE